MQRTYSATYRALKRGAGSYPSKKFGLIDVKENSFNLLTENIFVSETLQRLTTGVRKIIPEFEN